MTTPAELVAELDAQLRAAGGPERAEQERRYLKSSLTHYGVTMPGIRSIAKAAPPLAHDELVATVEALWWQPADDPVHERRMLAVELLDRFAAALGPADVPLLERLLRASGTWALIDSLAASVVGAVVERHPAELGPALDRWAADPDFWLRRSALLALLIPLRRGAGDWDRFTRYADDMLDEREFFIRKAIGWILRDTAKRRPGLVFDWLLPRAARASGVTLREALKPLSAAQQAAITTARRSP